MREGQSLQPKVWPVGGPWASHWPLGAQVPSVRCEWGVVTTAAAPVLAVLPGGAGMRFVAAARGVSCVRPVWGPRGAVTGE